MTGYPGEDEGPDEVTWPGEKALSACPFCQGVQFSFARRFTFAMGIRTRSFTPRRRIAGMAQFEDGSTDQSIIAKWNTRSGQTPFQF